jgi:hypothetical protein
MESVPTGRLDVGKVALPLATVTALPIVFVPSMNWTVPGAVSGVTVAVKVTVVPKVTGASGCAAMAVDVVAAPEVFTT